MIVLYAESTFVLSLALRQRAADCRAILAAARSRKISLVLPSLALFEPIYKLRGEHGDRVRDAAALRGVARDPLAKYPHMAGLQSALERGALLIADKTKADRERLARATATLWRVATVRELTAATYQRAYRDGETAMSLLGADALVLASILEDAAERGAGDELLFLALDAKAFRVNAMVADALKQAQVKVFTATGPLVARLRAQGALRPATP